MEIRLTWQPIVDLGNGQAVGWEVLLRHERVSTPDYIRRATELGHALAIDLTVQKALEDAPLPNGLVFVNLLPITIQILAQGHRLMDLPGPLAQRVVWELSEEPGWPHDAKSVASLRRVLPGGRLALDDVGAGWADLERIVQIQPDYIKLARTLVGGVHRDPARQAVIHGLVSVAEAVGATVIAEGIETRADAETVYRLGVPLAQGFLFFAVDNHTA